MDRQFLALNDRWNVAFDQNQWIVQKRTGTEWRSVSFIASDKRILQRILCSLDIIPTAEAKRTVRCLPDSFKDWYASLASSEASE